MATNHSGLIVHLARIFFIDTGICYQLKVQAMKQWSDRLKDWMLEAGGMSAAELSRRSGINYDNVVKYLKGRTAAPRGDVLERLAAIFGRTSVELQYGVAPSIELAGAPLLKQNKVGTLEATLKSIVSWRGASVAIGQFGDISNKAFAVEINDESCAPRIEAGDVVVVDPEQWPAPGDFAVAHVVQMGGGICRKFRPLDAIKKTEFALVATNDDYPQITVSNDNPGEILGRVCQVIKRLRRMA